MAYTEITSNLANGSWSNASIGSVTLNFPNSNKFVVSAVTGDIYPSEIRGTCFSSDNVGIPNSTSIIRLDCTKASSVDGIKIKILYVTSGETNCDYAMFGQSGKQITTTTTYSSSNLIYATPGAADQNMYAREVEYLLTANTQIYIAYRKNATNNVGIDKLVFKVFVDSYLPEKFYYYGAWISMRGFAKNIDDYYFLYRENGAQVNFDGLPFPTTPVCAGQATTNQRAMYFYTSGSTSATLPSGNDTLISFKADGHKIGVATVNLYTVTGTTAADVRVPIPFAGPSNLYNVYIRQYLIGLAAINGNGDGYSHFDLVATNSTNGQTLSGKTGTGGYVRLYSSAFTADGSDVAGTIVGTRGEYETIEGVIPRTSFNDSLCDYTYSKVFNGDNTGLVTTFKDIKALDSEIPILVTGEALQKAVNLSDVGINNKGNITLNTFNGNLSDNKIVCWNKIRTLGNNTYYKDDSDNASPDWSGATTGITTSGVTSIVEETVQGITNQTTSLGFIGTPIKVAAFPIKNSNTPVSATVPSVFIRSLHFEMTNSLTEVVGYNLVDYGSYFFVSSGNSTTPIGTAVQFSDDGYYELDGHFNDSPITACSFNGKIMLRKYQYSSSPNVMYNARSGNQYYLYFQPGITVSDTVCQVGGTNPGITAIASFSVPSQKIREL